MHYFYVWYLIRVDCVAETSCSRLLLIKSATYMLIKINLLLSTMQQLASMISWYVCHGWMLCRDAMVLVGASVYCMYTFRYSPACWPLCLYSAVRLLLLLLLLLLCVYVCVLVPVHVCVCAGVHHSNYMSTQTHTHIQTRLSVVPSHASFTFYLLSL